MALKKKTKKVYGKKKWNKNNSNGSDECPLYTGSLPFYKLFSHLAFFFIASEKEKMKKEKSLQKKYFLPE